jgi:hypothetical protein
MSSVKKKPGKETDQSIAFERAYKCTSEHGSVALDRIT